MTAPIYVIVMGIVELTPEKHEKCIILFRLSLKGA